MIRRDKRILLTGATGFIGAALLKSTLASNLVVYGRSAPSVYSGIFHLGEINSATNFSSALEGIDVVVHTAARVHVMNERAPDSLAMYREVNTLGTLNLARQAAISNVKRFIFLSSVKVNGERTVIGKPFRYDDKPSPEDHYGQSKAEAEVGLWDIAKETGMDVVVIRPPLVYGPGVKANFAAMMRLAAASLPLPLGAIHNSRSFIALDNLVDLIINCVDHPNAANQVFLVSDGRDLSTVELLKIMAKAAGKKSRLIPIPMSWLKFAAVLMGKNAILQRLSGSLQVDITHTRDTLGWSPPLSVEEGIRRAFDGGV